jgi:hypothetical protein
LQTGRPSLTRNTEWQASWCSSDVSYRTLISIEGGSRHNIQQAHSSGCWTICCTCVCKAAYHRQQRMPNSQGSKLCVMLPTS